MRIGLIDVDIRVFVYSAEEVAHDRQRHNRAFTSIAERYRLILGTYPRSCNELRSDTHKPRIAVLVRCTSLTSYLHIAQSKLPTHTATGTVCDYILKHRNHRVGGLLAYSILRG